MKRAVTDDIDNIYYDGHLVPSYGNSSGGSGPQNLQVKNVLVETNGLTEVQPDEGYTGLAEVNVTTNVPERLPELDISTTITQNTTTTITAPQNSTLRSLEITTNVPANLTTLTTTLTNITTTTITAPSGYDGFSSVSLNVPYPQTESQTTTLTSNGSYTFTPDIGLVGINEMTVNVQVPQIPSQGTILVDTYSITLSTSILNSNATMNSYSCDLIPINNQLIMEKGCFIHETNGYVNTIYQSSSTPSIVMTDNHWYVLEIDGDPLLSGTIGQLQLTTNEGPVIKHTIPTGAVEDYLQFPSGYLQLIIQ